MRKQNFEAIRLALFAKSYAGYYFNKAIKESKEPDVVVNKLAKALLFKRALLAYFLSPKDSKKETNQIISEDTTDKDKILIYLQIEKQLTVLIQDKKLKENYVTEEYEYALLAAAIERVTGDSLSKINNDDEFERKLIERKRVYNQWYYVIARKYRLPTLRIIPFLTRLIKIKFYLI